MYSRNTSTKGDKRGSIIVLVLVFVVMLTFIVVAFLEEATSRIKYYGLFHNRDDLRTDAYSALEITLAVLNQYQEVEGALWGPSQGWGTPLSKAEFTPANASSVTVTFEDESAKLPLANLDYETLLILFEIMDFDFQESQALADGLLDWVDEDDLRRLNGFDGEDYEDMDPPYRSANAQIITWDEFKLIEPFGTLFWDEDGIPSPNWHLFKSSVSLFNQGAVNVNAANATVLELLSEKGLVEPRSLDAFRNGMDGEPGTADDRLIRRGQDSENLLVTGGSEITDSIGLLKIRVEAIRGQAKFALQVLLELSGSSSGTPSSPAPPNAGTPEEPDIEGGQTQTKRPKSRNTVKTSPSGASQLGYPFRFVRITENRNF